MMAFAKFMAGGIGRGARILLGAALIVLGLFSIQGTTGVIVAVIGVLPVLAGVFNFCVVAPIIGVPFSGQKALNS